MTSTVDKNVRIKEFVKDVSDMNQYRDYLTQYRRINSSINKAQVQYKIDRLNCVRNEFVY